MAPKRLLNRTSLKFHTAQSITLAPRRGFPARKSRESAGAQGPQWESRQFRARDGYDPEGNIYQLRQGNDRCRLEEIGVEVDTWMVYVGTVLVFMSTPGPSQLLMLSNSISSGFRKSIYTAAGDLSANFLQMAVASVGLASVMASSREFFVVVKWAGVTYLVLLGLRLLLTKTTTETLQVSSARSRKSLYWQGFITSAANPKAVVFFAALFPQFIDPARPLFPQFIALSLTYLTIDATFLCAYGKLATWISRVILPSARQYLDKVSGSFLIGAAVLLGLKDVERA